MEGLILNEKTKYVTYMCPIFDALGDDYIRSLNWRIVYPECGSVEQVYSFEHTKTSWISGDELVGEIRKNPNIQWWWGLLQGIPKTVSQEDVEKEDLIDIKEDPHIWENPVTMRSNYSLIEIEAFDSTLTVVISSDDAVLERLKIAFPKYEILSEYNSSFDEEKTDYFKEMNQFELFSMIFYVLDDVWDDSKDYDLGQFLSSANPFLFSDIGSADPYIYEDFKTKTSSTIKIKDSYKIAVDYIKSVEDGKFLNVFLTISEEEWTESVNDYLSEPHKC